MDTLIPDQPADWPSESRITTLFAVASAVERRPQTSRLLQLLLGLPARTPITPKLLCERLSWEEYWLLVIAYSEQLTQGARTARMDADT